MTGLSSQQPYPGLRPFDFDDREFFFGREAQVRALRQKLNASRLVAVVGRSGCGKSSLVRAGLVPMLLGEKRENEQLWRIATFRPQGRPMEELTKALLLLKPAARPSSSGDGAIDQQALRHSRMKAMLQRSSFGLVEAASELGAPPDGGILIIIDQFEEIFRFEGAKGSDLDEPTAFVRLLVSAANAVAPRIHILLTMRLDFLGDCARFQGLPEAISDGQFLVPNLNRQQRRDAIEEPARRCGATISPAVTQRLLNEIGDDPDQLPVLQHVLMRTWQQAAGAKEILPAHYEATGGIANAISRHADDVFEKLPGDKHRRIAERLFKAVSELDRRGRAIRRSPPLTIGEIARIADATDDDVVRVVAAFRAAECCFLMPPEPESLSAATPIDISHESLLRRWIRMTGAPHHDGWLVEEDKDGKTYRRLAEDAETFAEDRRAFLPPRQARQMDSWWKRAVPNAAWAERYGDKFALAQDLLTASIRRDRWQRSVKYGAVALTVLIVLVTVSLWLGESQKRRDAEVAFNASAQLKIQSDLQLQRLRQESDKQLADLRDQLQRLRDATVSTTTRIEAERELEPARPEVGPRSTDLREQLQALKNAAVAAAPRLDDVVQVAKADPDQAADAPDADQEGYMWIGSPQKGNLQTTRGETVSPTDVREGVTYLVGLNIFLRAGLPDTSTYAQQPNIGVLSVNSRVEVRGQPVGFDRPTGKQYWAEVRVVALGLPTVYFQFANGGREQAQAVSKDLQAKGYKIPGEERSGAAAGKRLVRYFYPQDKAAADKLTADANAVLQKLKYPASPPVTVEDGTDFAGKKNPAGTVELWLDLPPK
jgi:energy-coupling factor transporter ATP-binding protein EcfA2